LALLCRSGIGQYFLSAFDIEDPLSLSRKQLENMIEEPLKGELPVRLGNTQVLER
jgi:hypothetical protein